MPARRYSDFDERLAEFHNETCLKAKADMLGEFEWQGQRLIMAHHREPAAELIARLSTLSAEQKEPFQDLNLPTPIANTV